jgi:hypothetical protein
MRPLACFDQTDGDASVARGEEVTAPVLALWGEHDCVGHCQVGGQALLSATAARQPEVGAAQTPRCRRGANRPFLVIISPDVTLTQRYGMRGREQAVVRWNSKLAKSRWSRARQAESA